MLMIVLTNASKLTEMLPQSAADLGKISHKPTQMRVLEEAMKKGSTIYPTCGCFQNWNNAVFMVWFYLSPATAKNGCCLVMATA